MAWFQTVSDAVAAMLCACFNVDPESSEAASRFIPAYQEDTITPQAPRNKNVVYYALSEMQGSGFDYFFTEKYTVNGHAKTTLTKTIPVSVLLTFYGSNADDDAEEFWSMFQWDSGAFSPRAYLRSKNMVPIGQPDRPVSVYEVEGTLHRRRCDVRLNLAYLYTEEHAQEYQDSYVAVPPQINKVIQQ